MARHSFTVLQVTVAHPSRSPSGFRAILGVALLCLACGSSAASNEQSAVGGNADGSTVRGGATSTTGGMTATNSSAVGGSPQTSTTSVTTGGSLAQSNTTSAPTPQGGTTATLTAAGGRASATAAGSVATGGRGFANAGRSAGVTATGGRALGGAIGTGGTRPIAGAANGGRVAGGSAGVGGNSGSVALSGRSSGGAAASAGRSNLAGASACDVSSPPANVAAWIDESWTAEGRNNMTSRKTWLHDGLMKGNGQINICVRYGATKSVSTATRDLYAPAMQRWFNQWIAALYPYDCFPYPSITVKITGWAVKPGQESLLEWTDRSVPVYTEVSDGTDQAKGEPKCPDSCGFFFHPDHVFSKCPGGEDFHFDYTLWLDDTLPSGAAAEGSDWGVRIPVADFTKQLNAETFDTMLHEMGHGFGISDYYSWTGSKPAGGSVMMIGTAKGLTVGDQWMVRRYWKETKAMRYP